jgi:8-oxo-dGTP pyrophosphatase MutT (NUDIX family)
MEARDGEPPVDAPPDDRRPDLIRAAGGVVWRANPASPTDPSAAPPLVCLVHRPRNDDWTLPKGKLEPGEHPLAAALREVSEEADVRALPEIRLPRIRYALPDGTRKVVDFWSMRAVGSGGFEPGTEVDEIRWLPVPDAMELASYPQDAELLRTFAALPMVTGVLTLLRRAADAGTGSAGDRPVGDPDPTRTLTPLLALLHPARLVCAADRRCAETLAPLAALLALPVEVDPGLGGTCPPGETAGAAALTRLAELASSDGGVTVCGPESLVTAALAGLGGDRSAGEEHAWLLAFGGDRPISADRL